MMPTFLKIYGSDGAKLAYRLWRVSRQIGVQTLRPHHIKFFDERSAMKTQTKHTTVNERYFLVRIIPSLLGIRRMGGK